VAPAVSLSRIQSTYDLIGDTDVRIRDVDSVPRDKTIINANARLGRPRTNPTVLKGPWALFLGQVVGAANLDHSKHAACASEHVNRHKVSFVSEILSPRRSTAD
jgi:hypothetical protein